MRSWQRIQDGKEWLWTLGNVSDLLIPRRLSENSVSEIFNTICCACFPQQILYAVVNFLVFAYSDRLLVTSHGKGYSRGCAVVPVHADIVFHVAVCHIASLNVARGLRHTGLGRIAWPTTYLHVKIGIRHAA